MNARRNTNWFMLRTVVAGAALFMVLNPLYQLGSKGPSPTDNARPTSQCTCACPGMPTTAHYCFNESSCECTGPRVRTARRWQGRPRARRSVRSALQYVQRRRRHLRPREPRLSPERRALRPDETGTGAGPAHAAAARVLRSLHLSKATAEPRPSTRAVRRAPRASNLGGATHGNDTLQR